MTILINQSYIYKGNYRTAPRSVKITKKGKQFFILFYFNFLTQVFLIKELIFLGDISRSRKKTHGPQYLFSSYMLVRVFRFGHFLKNQQVE